MQSNILENTLIFGTGVVIGATFTYLLVKYSYNDITVDSVESLKVSLTDNDVYLQKCLGKIVSYKNIGKNINDNLVELGFSQLSIKKLFTHINTLNSNCSADEIKLNSLTFIEEIMDSNGNITDYNIEKISGLLKKVFIEDKIYVSLNKEFQKIIDYNLEGVYNTELHKYVTIIKIFQDGAISMLIWLLYWQYKIFFFMC